MIKSMTGFGKAEYSTGDKKITIEIRTLNSRQLDINLKVPAAYKDKEALIRNQTATALNRGKTDIIIYIDQAGSEHIPNINRDIVKHYFTELGETAKELNIPETDPVDLMKMALRMPDTLSANRPKPDEKEWNSVYRSFLDALGQTDAHRIQEGEAMKIDLKKRITSIEECLSSVEQFEKSRIDNIRIRLMQNLNEFFSNNNIDRNRFEQEIIYYLEKLDITEEKVRLANHIEYFRDTLSGKEPAGKKLGFISQEIGREINTIGSKANDFNIQKLVVQMKDELEKIKEQSLNIL